MCEFLDCMQDRLECHEADTLMEAAQLFDQKKVQAVLDSCKRFKVRRLFLFFVKRNQVRWHDELDLDGIELSSGPMETFKGGEFDSEFEKTFPGDIDALAG